MTLPNRSTSLRRQHPIGSGAALLHRAIGTAAAAGSMTLALALALPAATALANPNDPVSETQRGTARQVAEQGVPLAELATDAPESHVVRPGDTLWDISRIFLRRPWRWPELWGMNIQQISNPHLIYPGQRLVLLKSNGRARLQMATSLSETPADVRLSPQVRASKDVAGPIPSFATHLIQAFLNDALVLNENDLAAAPIIVAGRDGRVLLGRGDTAYVRGDVPARRDWRVFREPRPLSDPETGQVLGYEAAYVGAAELSRAGEQRTAANGQLEIVPASIVLSNLRQEALRGDRLAPASVRDDSNFSPRAPAKAISGSIVSIYGEGVSAGQYQIVALNRGRSDGLERGHVLAVLRQGETLRDTANTSPTSTTDRVVLRTPDERHGYLLVFRVFERVSYALIMTAQQPVTRGDKFSPP